MLFTQHKTYIGRFAPSPSGPLHLGSLVAALASYLDARASGGRWLVRMEDIDPPREQPGVAHSILTTLEAYGLCWDGDVLFQSDRSHAYLDVIEQLRRNKQLYPCTCSRRDLKGYGGVYPGFCRDKILADSSELSPETVGKPHSLRVKCQKHTVTVNDLIQGTVNQPLSDLGDFIIRRKDGLFAYQLAVVVDDAFQHVTHIVRGSDLLQVTPWQWYLQSLLHYPHPTYGHFPVVTQKNNDKLSKQNHAPAISTKNPEPILVDALIILGQRPDPDLRSGSVEEIIRWATDHWQLDTIPKAISVPQPEVYSTRTASMRF